MEAILITGRTCTGKIIAGEYIAEKHGYYHAPINRFIQQECLEQGIPASIHNLVKTGAQMIKDRGNQYFVDRAIEEAAGKPPVVSGIRTVGVVACFKAQLDCRLVSVEASDLRRLKRAVIRGDYRYDEPTLERFLEEEIKYNSPPYPQNVFDCIDMADIHIRNDSNQLEIFYHEIDEKLFG